MSTNKYERVVARITIIRITNIAKTNDVMNYLRRNRPERRHKPRGVHRDQMAQRHVCLGEARLQHVADGLPMPRAQVRAAEVLQERDVDLAYEVVVV